jgi:transcriptional regulator with XRE-family HTH domain
MDSSEFGKFIKLLRKKRGLTLVALSKASSVSQPHLSHIENGKRGVPSPELLNKLAKPLGVKYNTLMEAAGYLEISPEGKLEQAKIEFNDFDDVLDSDLKKVLLDLSNDGEFYEFLKEDVNYIFKDKYIEPFSLSKVMEVISYSKDWDWKENILTQLRYVLQEFDNEIAETEDTLKNKKKKERQTAKNDLYSIIQQPGITYKTLHLTDTDRQRILDMLQVLFER